MLNVKKKKKLNLCFLGILSVIFGYSVHSYLAEQLEVFPNKGISFGFSGYLLVGVAFLVLLMVLIMSLKKQDIGLMIVAVGGLINFVDRMVFGYVRDYWSLGFVYNNLADWIIVCGVLYSLVKLWKTK